MRELALGERVIFENFKIAKCVATFILFFQTLVDIDKRIIIAPLSFGNKKYFTGKMMIKKASETKKTSVMICSLFCSYFCR